MIGENTCNPRNTCNAKEKGSEVKLRWTEKRCIESERGTLECPDKALSHLRRLGYRDDFEVFGKVKNINAKTKVTLGDIKGNRT